MATGSDGLATIPATDTILLSTDETPDFPIAATGPDGNDAKCTTFVVFVPADQTDFVIINIRGLHKADQGFPVFPGQTMAFRFSFDGIRHVVAKSSGADVQIGFGIAVRNVTQ